VKLTSLLSSVNSLEAATCRRLKSRFDAASWGHLGLQQVAADPKALTGQRTKG